MQVDVKVYANDNSVIVHLNYMCSITSTMPDHMLNIKFQRSMMFVLNSYIFFFSNKSVQFVLKELEQLVYPGTKHNVNNYEIDKIKSSVQNLDYIGKHECVKLESK